ncbi:2464_t:CDS:2 [Entrophospora sp. SA101]|nr:2464_t:CDS:2 [Entrophospora sp. SA101]CAJ0913698.1 20896_t:CDS:2 [Entrophospora sp. SA101]
MSEITNRKRKFTGYNNKRRSYDPYQEKVKKNKKKLIYRAKIKKDFYKTLKKDEDIKKLPDFYKEDGKDEEGGGEDDDDDILLRSSSLNKKVEKIIDEQNLSRQERLKMLEERKKEKQLQAEKRKVYKKKRNQTKKQFFKLTAKGQPVMKARIDNLLEKIKKIT